MIPFSKFLKQHGLVFGISIGLMILSIATLLLVYAPEQSSYVLTLAGLVCSSISMFLISADVLKNNHVTRG